MFKKGDVLCHRQYRPYGRDLLKVLILENENGRIKAVLQSDHRTPHVVSNPPEWEKVYSIELPQKFDDKKLTTAITRGMEIPWPQCANCGKNEVGVESAMCRVRCSACGTIFDKDHWVSRQIHEYYEESLKGNSAEDRAIRGLLAEFLTPD